MDGTERVGDDDESEEVAARGARRKDLGSEGPPQEKRGGGDARRRHPEQLPSEFVLRRHRDPDQVDLPAAFVGLPPNEPAAGRGGPRYESLLIRLKIGRYIDMTMPPTITPRMPIMSGSSSVSSPATAVSTSSS